MLVNTGTWLKWLHRRDGIIGILPPVFYHSYQLLAVRISSAPDRVAVEYEEFEKPSPTAEGLTYTERLVILGREPEFDLPDRIAVCEGSSSTGGDG